MNRIEIRNILDAHKEHFRVLPINVMLDLQGIIEAIDDEEESEKRLTYKEWIQIKAMEQKAITIKEKPSVVGNRTGKAKKASKRPRK